MASYKKTKNADTDKGVMYEVEPFKSKKDREKIKQYLRGKKDLRDYALVMLGWSVGLRCGDLVSLAIGDVVNQDGMVKAAFQVEEEKTDKIRELGINRTAQEAIRAYLQQREGYTLDDWLFPSRKGTEHIQVGSVRKIIKNFCTELGIKGNYGTHSLRKTFGYCVYTQNADNALILPTLQKIFGHSSPSVTLLYIGITKDDISGIYQNLEI